MSRPTFTVITANFNSGEKLAGTVASVLGQGVDAEHLIQDGASTDASLALARQLAADSGGRVRVISEPDRGTYDAFNKGVAAAAGRYLYFLGAGDVLRPGALAAVKPLLPEHDRGFVYGDALFQGRPYDGPFDYRKLAQINICHQAIFYGREVFDFVGGYDLAYRGLADWALNIKCFGDRRVVRKYVPVLVADFEPGGLSGGHDAAFSQDRLKLLRQHLGLLKYAHIRVGRVLTQLRHRGRAPHPHSVEEAAGK